MTTAPKGSSTWGHNSRRSWVGAVLYPERYPIAFGAFDGAAQAAVLVVETLLWRVGLDTLFRAAPAGSRFLP